LLDRFLPEPEDEYHQLKIGAPAAVTFAAAKQIGISLRSGRAVGPWA
jgi:hypothetical protein